jgi:hypothetical protein
VTILGVDTNDLSVRYTSARHAGYHKVNHVLDGVYIAGAYAIDQADHLRSEGFRHVLKLYEGEPYFLPYFTTFELPVRDAMYLPRNQLTRGVKFIRRHVDWGDPVLVMCKMGISRSSTFVLAYLLERGCDLEAAYSLLVSQHPIARPHSYLWQSLIEHYGLHYPLQAVLGWRNRY